MELTIAREQLLTALQATTGVVERRHSLPILANVLLQADENGLAMVGSDMEIELTRRVTLEQLHTAGTTTVAGRKLLDICRALPESATVTLAASENRLRVTSGKSRFQLATLPAEEFRLMACEQTAMPSVSLPEGQLAELLATVSFAMAEQDVRYYLNGMLCEFSATHFTAVATDGHRLALRRLPLATGTEATQFIMPRKGVLELVRLLNKESDQGVQLHYGVNILRLDAGPLSLVSRLIDGRFPDYHRVIPANGDKIIQVDRDALRQLLQRVAILSNEKYHAVRLHFQSGLITVTTSNLDQEEAHDELAVDYAGPELEMGFNVQYLLAVLNTLPAGNMQITLATAETGAILTSPTLADACYVVMPMCF